MAANIVAQEILFLHGANGCVPSTFREVDDHLWQHADGDNYLAEKDVDPILKRLER